MPGVHRLEHVERFAATDLSDYDSVRSHPQRGAQQRPHVDRAGPLNAGRTRLQGDDVRLRKSKLRSVLDGHDPLVLTDRERERVQGGGLSTRGPARDEHASPVADGLCEEVDALTAHGPVPDKVVGRERTRRKTPDREDRPDKGDGRNDRVNARTVRKASIDERARQIDPPPERSDEPLDQDEDLLWIAEANARLLEAPVPLDPHALEAVHHHLGHAVVAQERRELAKSE